VLSEMLDDQPSGVWKSLTGTGSLFRQESFLRAVERAGPTNLRPRYATALRDGQPVLAVATQLIELTGEQLLSFVDPLETSAQSSGPSATPFRSATVEQALNVAISLLGKRGSRVLVCGSALSCGPHGVAFAEGEEPAALWHALVEALERIRDAEDLSGATDALLIKDVPTDLQATRELLLADGYRPIDNEPNMVLRLDPSWRTHRDYLSSMASKYRRAAEKVLDRVEAAGIRAESLEDISGCIDSLHPLYLHVQRRARLRPFILPPEFLPALATALGCGFRCVVLREGAGRPTGFVTVIRDGSTAVGYIMGYDPEVNRTVPVYFRLLHAVVEEALRMGCKRVSFGRTALDPKARLGAEPIPLSVWARHQQPSLHEAIASWLPDCLFERVPTRRPFGGNSERLMAPGVLLQPE
jgi:hypothetical protein